MTRHPTARHPLPPPQARSGRRAAFTLVELLVVMAVLVTLASLALLVVPEALTQDRTTDGAGTVRQTLMIAKARALRDNLPRGVRLVVSNTTPADPDNLAKTNGLWVTEMQYIEQPTPLVPKPGERIEVEYPLQPDGSLPAPPAPPNVFYMNISPDLRAYLTAELGASPARPVELRMYVGDEMVALTATGATPLTTGPRAGPDNFQLTIDPARSSLDALIRKAGAGATLSLSGFWVNRPAQPLLGEPPVQLPKNICIDLVSSQPAQKTTATGDYDLLFAPSGEILYRGEGQVNLWVRDYTKAGGDLREPVYAATADPAKGGEQQVVSLKAKSGSLGVFPIYYDPADLAADPFTFAKRGASSP